MLRTDAAGENERSSRSFLPVDAICIALRDGGKTSYSQVPVAQLDRASASGAEGYRFEPCRGYLQHKDLRRELDEEKVLVTMIVTDKTPA